MSRRRLCQQCLPGPDKPVKPVHLSSSPPPVGEQTSVCGEEGWEEGEGEDGLYSHRLSRYGQDFQPKPVSLACAGGRHPGHRTHPLLQDLITTGYVPYGSYVRDYPPPPSHPPFPPSDR